MAKRKIGFYYITLKKGDLELPTYEPMRFLLEYLVSLDRTQRKKDFDGSKFAFVDEYSLEEGLITVLFKSAKHSYRAPLLNRNTVEARENPKTMEEGEQMKTHMVVKNMEDSVIALIETGSNLLTGNNIVEYFNYLISCYNANVPDDEKIEGHFSLSMMPSDDFREVLGSLTRVTIANVFIEKRLLGDGALCFAAPQNLCRRTWYSR